MLYFQYLQERAEKFFQILFKNFKFRLNCSAVRIGMGMSKLISEMRWKISEYDSKARLVQRDCVRFMLAAMQKDLTSPNDYGYNVDFEILNHQQLRKWLND